MKKPVAIIVLWIFAAGFLLSASADDTKLVASNYSDRYHLSTCKVAKKIPNAELLVFQTPEEALAKNLVACKKCYPPTSSQIRD